MAASFSLLSAPFFRRPAVLFSALFALAVAPVAHAVVDDDLLPANLVGRTLTCVYGAATPNTLEVINNFTLQFTSASTYVRSATGLTTEGGTYTVLDSSIAANTRSRATTIQINNNWFSPGSTTSVLLVLTQSNGTGAYAASEFFNPAKSTGGTFTLSGTTTGGGGSTPTAAPVITSATTATATVGSTFNYQITATPAATSYSSAGGTAPVSVNVTTGLVTGTFTTAGTYTFSYTAANAIGSTKPTVVTVTVNAPSGVPAFTGSTQLIASVGVPFSYQLTTSPAATLFSFAAPTNFFNLVFSTGRVDGPGAGRTFSTAGTYTFTVTATNASGTSAPVTYSVVVSSLTSTAPVVDSNTSASGTVGRVFNYSVAASNNPTSWTVSNAPAWLSINASTGVLSGTPTAAGTFVISVIARNAVGSSPAATVTIVIGAAAAGTSTYSGAYGGTVFFSSNGSVETTYSTYTLTVSTTGAVSLVVGVTTITGTVNATGTITFVTPNNFGLSSGDITNQRFNATGTLVSGSKYRFTGTGYTGTSAGVVAIAAPTNLVGYRGKVGAVYQFNVTGASSGAVWGTDVYTDDSNVAVAAVHAGVLAVGETKTVTVTVLAGQNAYVGSTRNGITTAGWGAWTGSYSFAGASDATSVAVATDLPTAAPGFVAITPALAVGSRLVVPVTVTGGGTYTYRWYLNGILIAGATSNPYIVESVTNASAGLYAADVTNSFGTTRINAASVAINAAGTPTFNLQPFDKVVAPGGTFALATDASGTGLTYQWFRNGVALTGETGSVILRQNVNANDAGSYTVRVTNSSGSITSAASVVTLSATASTLSNISVRTNAGAAQIVIPGLTVSGTGSKRVVIRAVGPGLSQFGLTGVMADPKLAVYDGSTKIAESDNWDGLAASVNAFAAVGAFPLTVGSKDAALVTTLPASASGHGYTVQVSSANNQGGIVLIEVYDADTAPTSKFSNVSVRSISAPGADVLIMGLTLRGTGKRTLLVRGSGPTLASFGVTGTLADPKLTIFDSNSRELLTNNDWSNADFTAEMVQAQTFVGAFPLQAASKDSSTLSLLDAGGYTIQVAGNDGGSGEALVEVYEIP